MKEGDKVRIISGEDKGKTGEVIGPIPMSQVQNLTPGQDISMEGAVTLWAIEIDKENRQTVLKENEFELIED